jgi:N-formylmaleamate deformylase
MLSRCPLTLVALTLWLTALFSLLPLSALPSAPHSFRVEVVGRGRPMILIPGLASSGDTWKSTVARFTDRFECHVLTLAGFAGVPPIAEPLLASVRAELITYIRERNLDRPIVVGHSLGGTLAFAVASDHPDAVGPLVIVDMVPFLAGTAMQARSLDEARPRVAAMRGSMSGMTDQQWADYAKSGESVKYMVTSPADLATITLREAVARIRTPVLALGTWKGVRDQVLAAAKIDIMRPAFMESFAGQYEKVSRLHFVLAETARHFIMFDDPSWFFAQLDAFLADPDAATRKRGFDDK